MWNCVVLGGRYAVHGYGIRSEVSFRGVESTMKKIVDGFAQSMK